MREFFQAAIVASMVLLGSPYTLYAQTPDGETPAVEEVCNELIEATPGLYGLCVAFCEAHDCEVTFDPNTGEPVWGEDCKPADPKIIDVYESLAQEGDPFMPCLNIQEADCPCWDPLDLAGVDDSAFACTQNSETKAQLSGFDNVCGVVEQASTDTQTTEGVTTYSCSIQLCGEDPFQAEITLEEALVCTQQLVDEAILDPPDGRGGECRAP